MKNASHGEKEGFDEKTAKRKKSPFAVVWSLFTTLIVAAAVLLAVTLVGVRLLGFTPYAVLSPSMMPAYNPGDLVYVKETDPENIKKYDVLTFVISDNTVVTHRVCEVDRENRSFYTKGDANDSRDASPVFYENVLGTVRFSLPKLGYISTYMTSESGRYVGIVILCALALLCILPEFFKPARKKKA